MSGIAELLAHPGYAVSGSDAKRSDVTARLESACGVTVFDGHRAENVGDADVVVYSSAVDRSCISSASISARGADAAAVLDCRGRVARQDDDHVDDRARARTRGARSDGGHRRAVERLWQQRAAGAGE